MDWAGVNWTGMGWVGRCEAKRVRLGWLARELPRFAKIAKNGKGLPRSCRWLPRFARGCQGSPRAAKDRQGFANKSKSTFTICQTNELSIHNLPKTRIINQQISQPSSYQLHVCPTVGLSTEKFAHSLPYHVHCCPNVDLSSTNFVSTAKQQQSDQQNIVIVFVC